jgi:transposase
MTAYVLGIDIAKQSFDVALLSATLPDAPRHERAKTRHFDNTVEGFAALVAWLPAEHPALHACLEATSTYGLALADALTSAGCLVSVVNPYRVKHYAQSELQRSKTDRMDASVIARFCRSQRPTLWTPPTPAQRDLQGLVRRLADLQQLITQERNRLLVPGVSSGVRTSITTILAALTTEQAVVEAAITTLLATTPTLARSVMLVTSIPGIGRATAIRLVAELGDLTRFRSARGVAAYAGLVPAHRQSGTSLCGKPHLSKRGASQLRQLLFYPALAALRFNPVIRVFADRLLARGKTRMAVVGAVMHKLMRIVYGVLRTDTPFGVPSALDS